VTAERTPKRTNMIWIVESSAGEYSDYQEWPIKAFRSKAKAERFVVEAQARGKELDAFKTDIGWERWWDLHHVKKLPVATNEFDENWKENTLYRCYSIELDDGTK
jgi:hypothetical protein